MSKSGLSLSNMSPSHPRPPTIALPPRSSAENLFTGAAGFSPGPMTLLSSFFSPDASDPRSFSQLLAGAMASPAAASGANKEDSKFKQNRPMNLVVSESPMFMIPPGLSPSAFLNSPGIFSPAMSPFGMSHQQALAQVTAQAAVAQSNMQIQAVISLTPLANPPESYKRPSTLEPNISSTGPSELSQSDAKSQAPIVAPDKPAEDGYNWRKYGQKQVKGSQYPRSYYKCTHFRCPVKKKVERSPEGRIIEIIYKGQHNHEHSPPKKSAKGGNGLIENARSQANSDVNQLALAVVPKEPVEAVPIKIVHGKDQLFQESSPDSQPIEAEKLAYDEAKRNSATDSGPTQKRRNTGYSAAEPTHLQNTVVEPKIIVQTRSEVDLLDDGFRWRKYGQKVVKGNSHPRSYYKCTTSGCNVRKHVERASTDPKAVVTTYEGKHNHDIPVGRGSSLNVSSSLPNPKSQKVVGENHTGLPNELLMGNNGQKDVAVPQI
ncbi:unnamed protein product [Rhodiola kirilowii]